MGLLDGGLAAVFHKAFAGLYLPATLYARTLTYDGDGNPTATDVEHECRAQVDDMTAVQRAQAGYGDSEQRILVLVDSLAVEPNTDCQIEVDGRGRYAIMAPLSTDPAKSHWVIKGQLA